MTRTWCARVAFLGSAGIAVAETYRRGYTAPLLFGVRLDQSTPGLVLPA